MDSSKGCVVLVTGGSGFLGQHVVGLLQERADHVTEIRVLDVIPYKNKLDYADGKPVHQYTGSVTDEHLVQRACKGVDCVMHVASIVDTSLIPDMDRSYKINVEGFYNEIEKVRNPQVAQYDKDENAAGSVGLNLFMDGSGNANYRLVSGCATTVQK